MGGRVSGTVTDPSGAVVAKATVRATNTDTGIQQTAATDNKGFYSFPSLSIGHYDLEITSAAFRPYRRTGIIVDVNSALTVDAALHVGQASDVATVVENQLHVETTSTQMGEIITGAQMTAVPLNGRSYTDLLAPSARSCPGDLHHVRHRSGRGRERALSLRRFESRHHLDQRPAGIREQFSS